MQTWILRKHREFIHVASRRLVAAPKKCPRLGLGAALAKALQIGGELGLLKGNAKRFGGTREAERLVAGQLSQ